MIGWNRHLAHDSVFDWILKYCLDGYNNNKDSANELDIHMTRASGISDVQLLILDKTFKMAGPGIKLEGTFVLYCQINSTITC
jgi:hypothetical protein